MKENFVIYTAPRRPAQQIDRCLCVPFFLRKVIYLAERDPVALGEKLSAGLKNRPDATGKRKKF